jgi:hypothetical protein
MIAAVRLPLPAQWPKAIVGTTAWPLASISCGGFAQRHAKTCPRLKFGHLVVAFVTQAAARPPDRPAGRREAGATLSLRFIAAALAGPRFYGPCRSGPCEFR